MLESVVKLKMDFKNRDADFEEGGNLFIELCRNSSFCAGKFSLMAQDLYADIDDPTDTSTVISQVFLNQNIQKKKFFNKFLSLQQCLPFLYQSDDLRLLFATAIQNPDFRKLIFPLLFVHFVLLFNFKINLT